MTLSRWAAATALGVAAAWPASAQERVTRVDVVARAVTLGPRLAIARADSTAARAQLAQARQFDNPTLALGYTKDVPQQHVTLDIPLDFPWLRRARVGSAGAGLAAAVLRFAFERNAIAFDADTTYTRALSTAARAQLSHRSARDADSVLTIARLRRDAGDVSELDVQLALVNAGQMANASAADSLEAITSLLAVQAVMGLPADAPSLILVDTLEALPIVERAGAATPVLVAAAEESAKAAELALTLERRKVFLAPSLALGFDTHDPSGTGNTLLPTIGIALPLPLFNQNGAGVMQAQAQRDRALGELALARIEVNAAIARARRAATLAQQRALRSERLLDAANQVASLSLIAYREGAAPLTSVIEAQRTAREALSQHLDDLAAARNAAGLVRLLEAPANTSPTANRTNP